MNVGVVGGGLAGLATASALHAAGHSVTVYEAAAHIGGRMGTVTMEDHPVDVGFHVLHTAYPALRRWVDLDALDAVAMDPSTEVILPSQGKRLLLGDALRRPSTLFPTLRSVGPFNALRLLRWRQRARGRDLEAPLDRPSQSIDAGLANQGFSKALRQRVLQPLFAGITLDPERNEREAFATFTWGAMAKGNMVMPKDGIVAVPRQLASHLPPASLRTGVAAEAVDATGVTVDGTRHEHDKVVLAVPQHVAAQLLDITIDPSERRTTTMVYATDAAPLRAARLLLNGEYDPTASPVLHVHVPTLLHPRADGQHLVVATLLGEGDHMAEDVQERLLSWFPEASTWRFVGRTDVRHALPTIPTHHVGRDHMPVDVDGVLLAGDHTTHPSVQGTLRSAERVLEALGVPLPQGPQDLQRPAAVEVTA